VPALYFLLGRVDVRRPCAARATATAAPREGPARGAHDAARRMVVLAERAAPRRADLFAAIRKAVSMAGWTRPEDAGLAVRMATVLLDAGRPVVPRAGEGEDQDNTSQK